MVSDRRTQPWLRTPGLAITTLLFALGCGATASYSRKSSGFVATTTQFSAVAVLMLLAIVGAFTIGSPATGDDARTTARGPDAPGPVPVFLATFALAIVFMLAEPFARARGMAPIVSVLARVICQATAVVLIVRWSRARNWAARHYLAVAAGATITYSLFGLFAFLRGHTNLGVPTDWIDIVGQVVLTILVLSPIWWGSLRLPP